MHVIRSLKIKFYFSLIAAFLFAILIFCLSYFGKISDNLISFLSTIDAALFALSIGIYIYWREKNDFYKSLNTGLEKYLEYIIDDLPETNNAADELSIGYMNTSFVNEIISSGLFNEILPQLILFQGKIEFYVMFSKECITKQHDNNAPLKLSHKTNLDNSYQVLIEDAKNLLKVISEPS